ncbi:MAG: hypothetical protein K8T26_07040 [Lentisphaerae bacterium]|nr:hypothetical protein [Lentisphaerota bacterium]
MSTPWFVTVIARLACLAAFLVSPWLLARLLRPRTDWITTAALAGLSAIVLNTAAPIALHTLGIPIHPLTLALPQLVLVSLLVPLVLLLRRPLRPPSAASPACLWIALGFAVIVCPCTHLAGIDTYKWQGLATNVRVEACIPWLVHPASLLGFTPRAYPPIQPLLLASLQIMGGLGVGAGFYALSLLSGLTGMALAHTFARRYFDDVRNADWFAFLYVFSPVFMRYNHWATGRGLLLAVLPALLFCLMEFPRRRGLLGLPFACLLAALTHKAGLVAVAILLPARLLAFALPRTASRILPALLSVPFVLLAIPLSTRGLLPGRAGYLGGFALTAITRFGWMLPGAALGLIGPRGWLLPPRRRALFPAMLVTLPLAFPADMYGALLALPFITVAATAGLAFLRERLAAWSPAIARAAITLSLIGALSIVGKRTLTATPPRVWRAATFLEQHDPRGPYRIIAPGRPRVQMHAYVSGCPRFVVTPGTNTAIAVRTIPPLRGPPAVVARQWIDFGRNFLELSDVAVDWYGVNPRLYYVIIDGQGERPRTSEVLYDRDGIQILNPIGQSVPIRSIPASTNP